MRTRIPARTMLLPLALALTACESAEERLDRVIDEAKACEEGDTCVVAGGTDCTCGAPVNEEKAAEVTAAAADIECCDLFGRCVAVDCAGFQDVRCEDGTCIGE
jgi:hypothetical protein